MLYFNNTKISFTQNGSLTDLLLQQDYAGEHFAVTLNSEFVPRVRYSATKLNENDKIEIILPMQGG